MDIEHMEERLFRLEQVVQAYLQPPRQPVAPVRLTTEEQISSIGPPDPSIDVFVLRLPPGSLLKLKNVNKEELYVKQRSGHWHLEDHSHRIAFLDHDKIMQLIKAPTADCWFKYRLV